MEFIYLFILAIAVLLLLLMNDIKTLSLTLSIKNPIKRFFVALFKALVSVFTENDP